MMPLSPVRAINLFHATWEVRSAPNPVEERKALLESKLHPGSLVPITLRPWPETNRRYACEKQEMKGSTGAHVDNKCA